MPIKAQSLQDAMFSALDTTESDNYYSFDADVKHAINYAARKLLEWASTHQGSTRFNAEAIRDLRKIEVYQVSKYSRIQLPGYMNTLEAVYPRPQLNPETPLFKPLDPFESIIRPDATFLNVVFDATRKTREEFSEARFNPFEPGYDYEELDDSLKSYAYWEIGDMGSAAYGVGIKYSYDLTGMPLLVVGDKIQTHVAINSGGGETITNYTLTAELLTPKDVALFLSDQSGLNWQVGEDNTIFITSKGNVDTDPNDIWGTMSFMHSNDFNFLAITPTSERVDSFDEDLPEIQISPAINPGYCAIAIIKDYTAISTITDSVEIHTQMFSLMVELGLWWLSFKQGDGTNINGLAERDILTSIANYGLNSD